MSAPAAMVRPMIWLVEARASSTTGAWSNCGITPPIAICSPITAATAANTLFSALLPWASPALAISPYMKARKARLRALSASWARRL